MTSSKPTDKKATQYIGNGAVTAEGVKAASKPTQTGRQQTVIYVAHLCYRYQAVEVAATFKQADKIVEIYPTPSEYGRGWELVISLPNEEG